MLSNADAMCPILEIKAMTGLPYQARINLSDWKKWMYNSYIFAVAS